MMEEPKDFRNEILENEIAGFRFSEKTIRQAFVRKVYAILLLQLLLTTGIGALFAYEKNVKLFAVSHPELLFASAISAFVFVIIIACCDNVRRKHPTNLIFLFMFTIVQAIVVGFACSFNDENHVLLAVGLTALICFSLTLFAFQTKYDFTGWGPYLFIFCILLVFLSIVLIIFPSRRGASLISVAAAVLFSFYLIYDTQLMMGGKKNYAISPEEHIFAALSLYLDIINIFLYVLRAMR